MLNVSNDREGRSVPARRPCRRATLVGLGDRRSPALEPIQRAKGQSATFDGKANRERARVEVQDDRRTWVGADERMGDRQDDVVEVIVIPNARTPSGIERVGVSQGR